MKQEETGGMTATENLKFSVLFSEVIFSAYVEELGEAINLMMKQFAEAMKYYEQFEAMKMMGFSMTGRWDNNV